MSKKIFIAILFFGLFGWAENSNAYTIPSSRVVTWQGNAGAFTDWSVTRNTICQTLSPSGGNDAEIIQTALNNCPGGQVVKLNSGTFLINSTINWPKDNVSLRGNGANNTILQVQSGLNNGTAFDFANPDYYWTSNTNRVVSAGYAKDSTQITTSVAHGWSAGDFVLIDQANDTTGPPVFTASGYDGTCSWCSRDIGSGNNRFFGQIVKITSIVNTTTASFTPPLYQAYNPAYDIRAVKASSTFTTGISIENLKVSNASYFAYRLLVADGLLDSVISGVVFDGISSATQSGILLFHNTAFLTIKDSHWRNTQKSSLSNRNYGLWFMYGCSANLVVNNIAEDIYVPIVTEGGPNSGTVYAYNYIANPQPQNTDATGYGYAAHYNSTYMNLWEGNYIDNASIRIDSATGESSSASTWLRNRTQLNPSKTQWMHDFGIEQGNYYINFVGNVIGTAGLEWRYECFNTTSSECDVYTDGNYMIYRLGYDNPFDQTPPQDTLVKTTMLRHYNWDSVTNGTKLCSDSGEPGCQGGASDTAIPISLFYPSKPSWWCNETPWPPIGSDVSGLSNDIPAKRRYLGQSCTLGAADTTPPAAPQGLTVN